MIKLTPLDIQQQQFKIKFRGFDIRQVDAFLEDIADAFESLTRENHHLKDEIQRLGKEKSEYQEREENFKQAMLNSQKDLEHMKENARKSAELIIADAEVKAEKILNRAHNRLFQLHEDISELKKQRMQIEVQIRSIIEAHSKLLDIGKNEMKQMEEQDSKVKFLKKI